MKELIITETNRLLIRRLTKDDLNDLFEYLSDDEVTKYEPYKSFNLFDLKNHLNWLVSTDEMLAVVLKSDQKVIGNIYLGKRDFDSREIGFVFNKAYWFQGYAKESCTKVIEKLFEGGIHRIYAQCDPKNLSSWHLLESLNFKREAHFIKNVYFWKDMDDKPIWKDTFVYALLSEN